MMILYNRALYNKLVAIRKILAVTLTTPKETSSMTSTQALQLQNLIISKMSAPSPAIK